MAFLGWLNEKETEKKRGYRLPTEAQWEYACRAGTGGLYGGDDEPESLARIANVADASHKKVFPTATCIRGDDGFVYTAPVGSFEPNPWHLYDMIEGVHRESWITQSQTTRRTRRSCVLRPASRRGTRRRQRRSCAELQKTDTEKDGARGAPGALSGLAPIFL